MMSQTRYCSTCGTLLSQGAAICGECGARYQESPYERRATDAPGAWAQAPRARSRDLGTEEEAVPDQDGIELISQDALQPKAPGATALRPQEQYDQMMVTQPPTNAPGQGSASGAPSATGSSAVDGPSASSGAMEMAPPLDGCTPASPLKRFLAALVDGVIATVLLVPLTIGLVLAITQDTVGVLASVLVGVGVALPTAYTVLMIWLQGAKGFTLGKLILGLRTVRLTEGGPIGLLRSLGRWFLYGLASLIMALSVFLDPKKLLRGFHDRAVDSVVVDIKAGRNPMKPRPDDFERHSAEHYLGSPLVAVTTHENLLATPGAAWAGQQESSASSAAEGEPVQSDSWAAGPGVPSPYAPPPQHAQSAADTGWAPPEIPDLTPPPAVGQDWGVPAPQPDAQPSPAPQQWDAPAPPGQAPQQWQAPAPEQSDPIQQPPQQWAPPAQDQQWQAPAQDAPAQQQWQAPSPAPTDAPQQVPPEQTADAWDGGDIDEQTRVVLSESEDLGDLEQTRVSAVAPRIPKVTLRADDGTERVVSSPVVIGRNPATGDGEVQFVLKDETRSMSKTHLRLDGTGTYITVTDLGSTNGSAIVRADGSRESLVPDTPTVLPEGASLTLGDRSMTVERDS